VQEVHQKTVGSSQPAAKKGGNEGLISTIFVLTLRYHGILSENGIFFEVQLTAQAAAGGSALIPFGM
jgi:hypothetical protein